MSQNAPITVPSEIPSPGTVDLTKTVEGVRASFVVFATEFILNSAASTPYLSWLKLPVISQAFNAILKWGLETLSTWVVMQAFFLNTVLRKQSQASDFIAAIDALNALPSTATKEEYTLAEKNRMDAFRNFVLFSN